MPMQDKAGPLGQGPMTGRGLGQCGQGLRRGLGRCRGFGRGLGKYFGWNAPQTKQEKLEDAKAYRDALKEEIEEVEKEIQETEK